MNCNIRTMRLFKFFSIVVFGGALLASCAKETSSSTGWNYNDPKTGGFQKVPFIDQETGPGLVFIEGGTVRQKNHQPWL